MPVTIHKCFCLANIRYPDEVSSMLIDRFFALQLSKRKWLYFTCWTCSHAFQFPVAGARFVFLAFFLLSE